MIDDLRLKIYEFKNTDNIIKINKLNSINSGALRIAQILLKTGQKL